MVAVLAWGKPVLLPVALGCYLAFVLTPPCEGLERFGVPRGLAVAAVVIAAVGLFAVLGTLVASQVADLATQLHTYAAQVSQKVSAMRAGGVGVFDSLNKALAQVARALDPELRQLEQAPAVRLTPPSISPFSRLQQVVAPVIAPVALTGIVLVLTIFVLARREDLRGRLIRLVGTSNVTVATQTIDDATGRISRLLLTQAYINSGFGAVVALGLYAIGLPYALLFGALAGLLRFVPLLGSLLAVLFPSVIALAAFPSWRECLLTLGLFAVLDVTVANFLEPAVLGKRTGVSSFALLVSTLFWTWLWGPVGLVLATPVTVCAATVGRHVPQLNFLTVLLGEDSGLKPEVNLYQRLLARASSDAQRIVKQAMAMAPLAQVLDELFLPTIALVARDLNMQAIAPSVSSRLLKDLGELATRVRPVPTTTSSAALEVIGVPAESETDAVLSLLLQRAAGQVGLRFTVQPLLERSEQVQALVAASANVFCIAAFPPNATANARFLCRRLRAIRPDAHIVVVLPTQRGTDTSEAAARLREAGASAIAGGALEALSLLTQRLQLASTQTIRAAAVTKLTL